ncbi:6-bladed beta-propeller [Aliifodinibius sp. S!AR15-10]|uniref:6-bladed beta-propeller n=1 Tax=Aliifodinibius sp. S!AR15-10 TaxID=2950437 RepID=UPI0028593B52|nr:6-bladed beta-propeller [Aliifodinibius sp. S!AR15-10]MDR8393827.1 6-bladed beta-propeller [Aliifodinibius sp. S!AR15-10]
MRRCPKHVLSLFIFGACSGQPETELPEDIKKLENLTVYPADVEPAKKIELKEEQSFSSLQGRVIGKVGDIAVDKANRVFIGDPQQHRIHIFSPNGRYDSYIGKEGHGPGEFQGLSTITIDSSEISVYDPVQLRMNFYALKTLSLS